MGSCLIPRRSWNYTVTFWVNRIIGWTFLPKLHKMLFLALQIQRDFIAVLEREAALSAFGLRDRRFTLIVEGRNAGQLYLCLMLRLDPVLC